LLAGGRSNLTYALTDGESRWVLRRSPLGHVLATAHDMRREYVVLQALEATAGPRLRSRRRRGARYAERTGADLADVAFYRAFALFKLAAIAQTIVARHRQVAAVDEGLPGVEAAVGELIDEAHAVACRRPRRTRRSGKTGAAPNWWAVACSSASPRTLDRLEGAAEAMPAAPW
jgi:predicted transcriptional regulator